MDASAVPLRFQLPFAADATGPDIRTVPVPSQIGVQDGAASFTDGFPPDCFKPVSSGGVPPFGQDFNGLLNIVTTWIQWYQAGAPVVFNSAFAASIGGYPNGAVLPSTTPGRYWRSTADNNTTDPDGGSPANWVNYFPQSITGNSGTATKLQTARSIILASGVNGSGAFDGSGNVTINVTLVAAAVAAALGVSFNGNSTGHFSIASFIINWGSYSLGTGGGAQQHVTFDAPFPNFIIHPWVSVLNAADQMVGYVSPTNSGMTIQKGISDALARSGSWFAIGF